MTGPGEHILKIENLNVDFHTRFGLVHAVRDVSLHVEPGETLAVLGESGSGKSVTASAILNLIDTPPGFIRSGRIFYRGEDLLTMPAEARRRVNGRKIAMIFQDPLAALNPVYPVGWQIAELFRVHGLDGKEGLRRAVQLLDRVGIANAGQRIKDYPHQFSGGQRQRVMIAMATALRPDLLVADEPTTALDVTVQAEILKLLKELQAEVGMSLLLITHDLGVVAQVADRVVVMQDGRIVETGEVGAIFRSPKHPYTRRLIDAIPGRHGYAAVCEDTADKPLLKVVDLGRSYGAVRVLQNVSFELHRGETLGIVGESGSGKSTLARTILGLDRQTTGTVSYHGKDVSIFSAAEMVRFRRRMQVVFQDPTASLNPYMTIGQIIAEPWTIHRDVLPKERWSGRVRELLERVGLKAEHALRHPHQFSGGQRQRIAIARAIALNPEMIICDEAVSALDVSIQAQVIDLLRELRREFGFSYIFIAHDLAVVRDFCERILVMNKGRIVEEGITAEVFENPQHPYTRQLLRANPIPDPDSHPRREHAVSTAAEPGP